MSKKKQKNKKEEQGSPPKRIRFEGKYVSADLELRAVAALCSSPQDIQVAIFSACNEDHFVTETASDVFNRIKHIMSSKGTIPDLKMLAQDPGLSEYTRGALGEISPKHSKIINVNDASVLVDTLEVYRKQRSMVELASFLSSELNSEEIDVDGLFTKVADRLNEARSGENLSDKITFEKPNSKESKELLEALLRGDNQRFIPTGVKAFDDRNMGLPAADLTMIAANTGGGKSLLSLAVAKNMATLGVKVAVVALEMNKLQVMQRIAASYGVVNMTALLDPKSRINSKEHRNLFKQQALMEKRIEKSGGRLDVFEFKREVSIDTLLFQLQSQDYDIVLIDYVGLLEGTDGDDQAKALGRVGRFAKVWATTTGVATVLVAQLSDDGMVRYSRAMKEHAAVLLQWVAGSQEHQHGIVTVTPTKSRSQDPSPFEVYFDWEHATIRDVTDEDRRQRAEGGGDDEMVYNDEDDDDIYNDSNGKKKGKKKGKRKKKKRKRG